MNIIKTITSGNGAVITKTSLIGRPISLIVLMHKKNSFIFSLHNYEIGGHTRIYIVETVLILLT